MVSEVIESATLNLSQAAKRIGVDRHTVARMVDRGELSVLRIGRSVRISKTALDRWIEAGGEYLREAG